MHHSSTRVAWSPRQIPEPWRAIAYFAAVYIGLALGWWDDTQRALARAGAAGPVAAIPWFTAASLAVRGVAWCVESGFYVLWWRAWGRRLPFGLCLRWIVVFSGFALMTQLLIQLAHDEPGSAVWLAPFAGPGVFDHAASPWSVFGDAGLLTATRIFLTADVQARALGVGRLGPFALCVGAWLVTRLALWVLADLARGRSPWA